MCPMGQHVENAPEKMRCGHNLKGWVNKCNGPGGICLEKKKACAWGLKRRFIAIISESVKFYGVALCEMEEIG